MHEMSIAVEIVHHAVEVAERHQATRIEEVEVEVGVMRQVVPEAIQMAWETLTRDTLAEGAVLKITEVPPSAVCRQCGQSCRVTIDRFVCPHCNQADLRIETGNDVVLMSIVCQTEEGPCHED